jgi:hypothetical protein
VRRAKAFDPAFVAFDPLFAPLEPAYRRLGSLSDFPSVASLGRVFAGEAPVRFVPAGPRRRRGEPPVAEALYDGRIVVDGAVPTRAACWHDLMNALVWGTFPRSKHALHARQHRAISARIVPGARGLPARSRELDALALVDEGGVVVLARDPVEVSRSLELRRRGALTELLSDGDATLVVFGHAIYESLALGVRPAVVAAVVGQRLQAGDCTRQADVALARALEDPQRFLTPRELVRVDLSEARPPADEGRSSAPSS